MRISSKIIFSSIFFFFVVFVFLSLIVSSLSDTFSQLFLVFSYPHRAYDFASNLLLGVFALMCVLFIIRSKKLKRGNTTEQVAAILIALCAIVALVLRIIHGQMQDKVDDIVYAFSDSIGGVLLWKIVDICVYLVVYVFFILLPLVLPALKIQLNVFNKWGEWLNAYKPSINTALFLLFAYAIQPYYDKSSPLLYVDLWLFYVGFALVVVTLYRRKEQFGFYEYANLLWLVIGILIFSFCSKIISQADYVNTRTIFIIIGIMAWCGEWMVASLEGDIKPSGIKELFAKAPKKRASGI
ncbi:hypothetical protein BKN38_02280 [Helicobacter sp. CLO-3]|uniref:hypothetical protein n=1 Tax=unclassified Helicobacter TaxID=2593540 RepID=UPI0008048817|nr:MULTISPECIES: hypothetical protein [unclassified Helicobacter]OBV29461.1 hypothetical protein BA723_00750 [Helicobacter sp. CLO-3]OHU84642.1 hypothetical protein BKN38_02280 [Helicobacter sp. CLO-3]